MIGNTNEPTRREWRELGFFYEVDLARKIWKLVGSRAGLARFAHLLRDYANDPANGQASCHQSYGPYLYLRVETASHRGIHGRSIHGSPGDLLQLASIVETVLASVEPPQRCEVHWMYAPDAEYSLVFEVKADGFDPASADRMLPRGN